LDFCILFESAAIREYEALEARAYLRDQGATRWTRRTGLKVPSGLGAFLQTTREGDKGRVYFLFAICHLIFAIL
jgi:hypothetical protein